eukprot:Polyplicarium_translucidae@DN3315_c1_g2_i2.p3
MVGSRSLVEARPITEFEVIRGEDTNDPLITVPLHILQQLLDEADSSGPKRLPLCDVSTSIDVEVGCGQTPREQPTDEQPPCDSESEELRATEARTLSADRDVMLSGEEAESLLRQLSSRSQRQASLVQEQQVGMLCAPPSIVPRKLWRLIDWMDAAVVLPMLIVDRVLVWADAIAPSGCPFCGAK